MKTSILLSTFNGEKYLKQQLDSLINQTYSNFKIYIRDDGSSDLTHSIIDHYTEKYNNKIILTSDDFGNIGVAKSYRLLMENVDSDFYMFADQDDVWEENKIEKLLAQANLTNRNQPYLIFSNMTVFYSSGEKQSDFFKTYRINEVKNKDGLFRGTISGCLMLFNHEAKLKSLELNKNSNMLHDWDMYISTYIFGKIDVTNLKLIRHRIHRNNAVGENLSKSRLMCTKDLIKYLFNSKKFREITMDYYFNYLSSCIHLLDNNLRKEKELLTENEINNLAYFQRKKWYLKHFNPFIYGRINGLLILSTV